MTRDLRRLRRLIDLRRRQEEQARLQLAQSLRKASELSDEVRARTEAFERALEGETAPRQRPHLEALLDFAEPALLAARAAEASALGAVDEVRREWNRAAVRLKGMERLEERTVHERDEKIAEAERHALDDATNRRGGDDS